MLTNTVIFVSEVAAFVLDIGPGDLMISVEVDVSDDGTGLSVEITSDGVDIAALALVDGS